MAYFDGSNFILCSMAAVCFIGLFLSLIVNIELWRRLQTLQSPANQSSEIDESRPIPLPRDE